jgi:pimeloyl-ACP methyl ester carboxylesterase
MASGNDGLYPVSNTTAETRAADIVFVHGLGGSSHDTWRYGEEDSNSHFFWPEELGNDLTDCGVWTLGYPAGFARLGKPGMIIEKRAGNLSQKLANAGLGSRPIIFVCHSMGGLVVKSLVADSAANADEDRKQIASMVRGIVFCATPHRGSSFADAASVLGQVLLGTQAHVDEMRANAEPLDLLHDRFVEWQRNARVPVDSYAENIGLFRQTLMGRPLPLGLVVPRASANTGIAGHSIKDVDADHLTLVKPPNRQHDVYAGVLRFIRKLVPLVPGPPNIVANIEHAEETSPLRLLFSKAPRFPSIQFSILNESSNPVQIVSIRAIIASKAKDNHTGVEYATGIRTQLKIDINSANEGQEVELLDERVISLKVGEIEAFSLTTAMSNTTALIDLDIDYVEVGAREVKSFSPDQLILAHSPVDELNAPGCFELINRCSGIDIMCDKEPLHPWKGMAYSDCRQWQYALVRGAGCFLIGDVNRRWPALKSLLARKPFAGPTSASVAEVALRRKMPIPIIETLRNMISDAAHAGRLGISDDEAYSVTVAAALRKLT